MKRSYILNLVILLVLGLAVIAPACRNIIASTCRRVAPSAMRTPISRVRCATRYDITP